MVSREEDSRPKLQFRDSSDEQTELFQDNSAKSGSEEIENDTIGEGSRTVDDNVSPIYRSTNVSRDGPKPRTRARVTFKEVMEPKIILECNGQYVKSFTGMLRLLQVILPAISLLCLTTTGQREGGYLLLPLSWHFRFMVFVLVLSFLSSFSLWISWTIGIVSMFQINWYLLDLVLYSLFSFMYLVGASLVASAFDFFQKMGSEVSEQTMKQLVLCVVLGYICMFVYGASAVIGFRQWRNQLRLFHRRKLLEEDDLDI